MPWDSAYKRALKHINYGCPNLRWLQQRTAAGEGSDARTGLCGIALRYCGAGLSGLHGGAMAGATAGCCTAGCTAGGTMDLADAHSVRCQNMSY